MSAAGDLVNRARTHLRSAAVIAGDDPTLALSACHDAARQAISAHLRAIGYRIKAVPGAHRLITEYAKLALQHSLTAAELRAVDHLRRDRHTAEYGDYATRKIGPAQVEDAARVASRVVDAVAADLASMNPPSLDEVLSRVSTRRGGRVGLDQAVADLDAERSGR